MREFSDLPPQARELMIGSVMKLKRQLKSNLSAAREKNRDNHEALAGLVLTFFCGICLEQNLNPAEKQIAGKIAQFMQLIRAM
jgi:dsRNA-specific ribonuclease